MYSMKVSKENDYFELCIFQGDAWICMELMDTSFDQCYKCIYCDLKETIPEDILGVASLAVSHSKVLNSELL